MRILYYTGKGGTGKSTISCITSIKAADLGYKTILVSSDPAHSLRDVLRVKVGREVTKVIDNLYAINIDPVKEAAENYSIIIDYIASVLKARGIDESLAYEIASLPGMTGVVTMLKLNAIAKEGYDVIVIDTVPSGEALRYLYVPTIIGRISRKIMKIAMPFVELGKVVEPLAGIPAPSKEVVKKEVELLEMFEGVKDLLLNRDVTSLRLVTNPDSFSIANARRAYMQASIYGLNTDLIVVNKVLPEEVRGSYFNEWLSEQQRYIEEAVNSFRPIPVKFLRLFKRELKGIDDLRKAADELFGDGNPTEVYHKGEAIKVEYRDKYLEVTYPAPFISKKEIEVERVGDELILRIYTDAGPVDLVIPLPAIAFKLSLKKAKLINGYLHLYFGE
mgnify:CR=1 FL=1